MSAALTEFLRSSSEAGGLQTDDVLAGFLPLAREVAEWHEQGLVAPPLFSNALHTDAAGALAWRDPVGAPVVRNDHAVAALQRSPVSGLKVVGRARVTSDDEHGASYESLDISPADKRPDHPMYLVGYCSWEQAVGHHDPLADVFSLGLLLAALALDLDLDDRGDVEQFVRHRNDLFALNARAHPVIVAVILEMTELDRHRRAPDLPSVIRRLETWRDQPTTIDFAKLPGFAQSPAAGRRALVKTHLRDRLFEISRRNRMLYFRPTQASVNLTVASVPLVIRLSSIRREHLFVWQGEIAAELSAGGAINLGKHLRFEDQPYLAGALDRLISDARRDRAEFGFAQLRLVLAFLHWHNLKEGPEERIQSPLLLLPVELTRKKGVRDHYVLTPTGTEAEVNPVLRHHLKQLYDLDLPETVDLGASTLAQVHAHLQQQIRRSEPAVTLRLVEQPEIELIHEKARQRLAQFKRRQLRIRPTAPASFDYSYRADDFRPLGLQLFRERVLPKPLPQRAAAGGAVEQRAPHMVAPATPRETERQTFALREQRDGNKYLWDLDLCSITLANFNYRKMSLVRDYGALIDEATAGEVFDRVFSVEPRAIDDEAPAPLPLGDEWPVVPGDATQRAAVALARTGRSYIVQGPPGTGKSQTITNLIADYVARNKRVLFVCEKRAALDVVFHRLRQRGLDELCCLIHDSQTDKKGFVQNLKQTYETWLAHPDGADEAAAERAGHVQRMQQDLAQLERFDATMTSTPAYVGGSVRELVATLAGLREQEPRVDQLAIEQLPTFEVWRRHADLAYRLSATLDEVCGVDALAKHPFKTLSPQLIRAERPLQTLHDLADEVESLVDETERALEDSGLSGHERASLADIEQLVKFAVIVAPIAKHGQLGLLDESSPLAQELERAANAVAQCRAEVERARLETKHWRDKLEPGDAEAALAQARAQERSIFRFFSSSWRKLKRTIDARYDFARHAVRPTYTRVLQDLKAEHDAEQALVRERMAGATKFFAPADEVLANVRAALARSKGSASVAALCWTLLQAPRPADVVAPLAQLEPTLTRLLAALPRLLVGVHGHTAAQLGELIRDLRDGADALPDLLPVLAELTETHEDFIGALRRFELAPDALSAASARKSLELLYRAERWLPRFDARVLEHCTTRLAATERHWLESNAVAIRSAARKRFRGHVQLSTTSVTQLGEEERALKKTYAAGRRELEHEFGKTMRYKSIRDLAAGDSGAVIRHLKPIWLMSPLSVSDTLPLDVDLFDVVIFDEASQIPVEEAVPALYRARQVIVVGDEMQLPPTSFFTARASPDTDVEVEEEGERVAIALDADSLLTQSARNLPATLLAWHYRSRSESLIGFSNAAFYGGNLYTIPDRELPAAEQATLSVRSPADAAAHVDALLARPVSFHLLESSPYDSRRNAGEAAYIAELLRELLRRGTKLSIGVAAFSEAQQGEIEGALELLAAGDTAFAALLEEAYVREESDQFCGLFIKNLENVQGDERDIIILSICYGPDQDGRMVMNFGPINQRGGEKRLNVIFSRARHHMAVVSSIRHEAITNDYNDGAATLKRFLQYAETASAGDAATARVILEGLNVLSRKASVSSRTADPVVMQLAEALRARGYVVADNVGQSRFRCDLAVRAPNERSYGLAVLVDTEEHYANRNVGERYVTRPEILRSFGWQVMTVLTRDWYHEPQAVLERIERRLRGEKDESVEAAVPPPIETAPAPASVETAAQQDVARPSASAELANVRRCEFIEGRSSKFWEIAQTDTLLTIRYGRIGTAGQTMTKTFDTAERATRERDKLLGEKLRKGYREVPAA